MLSWVIANMWQFSLVLVVLATSKCYLISSPVSTEKDDHWWVYHLVI